VQKEHCTVVSWRCVQLSPIEEDDDTISVYVFGEDEAELEKEARENDGYLRYEHVANQYGDGSLKNVRRCVLYAHMCGLFRMPVKNTGFICEKSVSTFYGGISLEYSASCLCAASERKSDNWR